MTRLPIDEKLFESKIGDEVRTIANSRTLIVLESLSGQRKGRVVRFLYEAGLIIGDKSKTNDIDLASFGQSSHAERMRIIGAIGKGDAVVKRIFNYHSNI
jgi:hypothetical protein